MSSIIVVRFFVSFYSPLRLCYSHSKSISLLYKGHRILMKKSDLAQCYYIFLYDVKRFKIQNFLGECAPVILHPTLSFILNRYIHILLVLLISLLNYEIPSPLKWTYPFRIDSFIPRLTSFEFCPHWFNFLKPALAMGMGHRAEKDYIYIYISNMICIH